MEGTIGNAKGDNEDEKEGEVNKTDSFTIGLVSLVIGLLLFCIFAITYITGLTAGAETRDPEVTAYKQAACAYAKDAGRELPEWCKK